LYLHHNLSIKRNEAPKSSHAYNPETIPEATAQTNIDNATPNVRLDTPIPSCLEKDFSSIQIIYYPELLKPAARFRGILNRK